MGAPRWMVPCWTRPSSAAHELTADCDLEAIAEVAGLLRVKGTGPWAREGPFAMEEGGAQIAGFAPDCVPLSAIS